MYVVCKSNQGQIYSKSCYHPCLLFFFFKKKKLYIFMSNYSLAISLPLLCQKKKKKVLALHFKIIWPSILKLFLTFPPLISPLPFFFFLPNPLADNHHILNISIFLFSFLFSLFNIHPPKPPHSPLFFSSFLSLCWLGFVDFFFGGGGGGGGGVLLFAEFR
jgi:hypothetical protein